MKKIKIIISLIILLIGISISSILFAESNLESVLNIDTNLENATFDEKGIHIEGWRLATQPNKIAVLIDGKQVDNKYIKYSKKYDLISIVKGYGTYEENPQPMFDIDIPIDQVSHGKHNIEIQMRLEDETIIESVKKEIKIEKIKNVLNIDTNLDNATFDKKGIHIEGWRLATETNKIVAYIDEKQVDNNYIKYSKKYDLISIVKGYGTYKENPQPMFDIDIPTTGITNGKHNLKIEVQSKDGIILESIQKTITIDKKVKHALQIDTNLDNATFDRKGIHIEGWRLATETNKIVAYIDGKQVDNNYIKYTKKYDLISIVKGYGTYEENPQPMFDIDIPTTEITNGKHNLKIEIQLEDGTIIESVQKQITVDKKVKNVLNIDTNLDNATFDKKGIHIEGWRLATEKNKIVAYIDGEQVNENYIKYTKKYDLISIVKGYGTYKENPQPMFDIDIPTTGITNGKHNLKIEIQLEDGTIIESVQKQIIVDTSIKHILFIDTDISKIVFNEKKGIHIEGWRLASEAGAKLVAYIDGQKLDEKYITYSKKYDLISIVKGYGTYKENPQPMFDIDIPTNILNKQNHIIKIQYLSPDGATVLDTIEFVAMYGGKYKGIDVSEKNGSINWKQVAQSDIDFAMIRIGIRGYRNPNLVLDKQALKNLREAKQAGLKIGVYFVTQAINLNEAQEEALWVVSQLHQNGIKLDYPIAIDTEDSGARAQGYLPGRADLLDVETRTMICRAFCDVVKYQGFIPAVYTSKSWFTDKLNFSELSNYDIWVAHYTYDEDKLTDFKGDYEIWQYSDKGKVPGVSSQYTDLNISYKQY